MVPERAGLDFVVGRFQEFCAGQKETKATVAAVSCLMKSTGRVRVRISLASSPGLGPIRSETLLSTCFRSYWRILITPITWPLSRLTSCTVRSMRRRGVIGIQTTPRYSITSATLYGYRKLELSMSNPSTQIE